MVEAFLNAFSNAAFSPGMMCKTATSRIIRDRLEKILTRAKIRIFWLLFLPVRNISSNFLYPFLSTSPQLPCALPEKTQHPSHLLSYFLPYQQKPRFRTDFHRPHN